MSQEIQRHITAIYDELDRYHTSKDFKEIQYWSTRHWFSDNDEYQISFMYIERLKKLVIKHLNQLAESADDLALKVNQCKQLIILKTENSPEFTVRRHKYCINPRLGAKNESKM